MPTRLPLATQTLGGMLLGLAIPSALGLMPPPGMALAAGGPPGHLTAPTLPGTDGAAPARERPGEGVAPGALAQADPTPSQPGPADASTPAAGEGGAAPEGSGKPAEGDAASPALTPKEKELLERIRSMKSPRWRSFGACRYDWGSWRLNPGEVRTTAVECGDPPIRAAVAVHCPTLRITRRVADGDWEAWRLPLTAAESASLGGEDEMVASLCANITPAPGAPPAAGTQPSAPPGGGQPSTPAKPGPPPEPGGTKGGQTKAPSGTPGGGDKPGTPAKPSGS